MSVPASVTAAVLTEQFEKNLNADVISNLERMSREDWQALLFMLVGTHTNEQIEKIEFLLSHHVKLSLFNYRTRSDHEHELRYDTALHFMARAQTRLTAEDKPKYLEKINYLMKRFGFNFKQIGTLELIPLEVAIASSNEFMLDILLDLHQDNIVIANVEKSLDSAFNTISKTLFEKFLTGLKKSMPSKVIQEAAKNVVEKTLRTFSSMAGEDPMKKCKDYNAFRSKYSLLFREIDNETLLSLVPKDIEIIDLANEIVAPKHSFLLLLLNEIFKRENNFYFLRELFINKLKKACLNNDIPKNAFETFINILARIMPNAMLQDRLQATIASILIPATSTMPNESFDRDKYEILVRDIDFPTLSLPFGNPEIPGLKGRSESTKTQLLNLECGVNPWNYNEEGLYISNNLFKQAKQTGLIAQKCRERIIECFEVVNNLLQAATVPKACNPIVFSYMGWRDPVWFPNEFPSKAIIDAVKECNTGFDEFLVRAGYTKTDLEPHAFMSKLMECFKNEEQEKNPNSSTPIPESEAQLVTENVSDMAALIKEIIAKVTPPIDPKIMKKITQFSTEWLKFSLPKLGVLSGGSKAISSVSTPSNQGKKLYPGGSGGESPIGDREMAMIPYEAPRATKPSACNSPNVKAGELTATLPGSISASQVMTFPEGSGGECAIVASKTAATTISKAASATTKETSDVASNSTIVSAAAEAPATANPGSPKAKK